MNILITGASRGIGQALAQLAGAEGARVGVGFHREETAAKETLTHIKKAGGDGMILGYDVAEYSEARKAVEEFVVRYGSLDVLVNNAGIISWKPMEDEKISRLHRILDVNVKGMVNMTYAAIKYMRQQTGGGVIVNIASGAGKTGYANLAVYSASKFAVLGFTQAVAQEVMADNIRVYAVCPGMTATDMTGDQGMPATKVADRIWETANERLKLKPGEDTEIYS